MPGPDLSSYNIERRSKIGSRDAQLRARFYVHGKPTQSLIDACNTLHQRPGETSVNRDQTNNECVILVCDITEEQEDALKNHPDTIGTYDETNIDIVRKHVDDKRNPAWYEEDPNDPPLPVRGRRGISSGINTGGN